MFQKTILLLAIAALLLTASTGYAIHAPQKLWDTGAMGGSNTYYGQGMAYNSQAYFGKIRYGALAYGNTLGTGTYGTDNDFDATPYSSESYTPTKSFAPLDNGYLYGVKTDGGGLFQFKSDFTTPAPLDGSGEIVYQAAAQGTESVVSDGTYLYGNDDYVRGNIHRYAISGVSDTGFTATPTLIATIPGAPRIRGITYNYDFDHLYVGDHQQNAIYRIENPGSATPTLTKIGDNIDNDGEYQVARYGSGNELYVVGESYEGASNADLVIYDLNATTGMIIPGTQQEIDLGLGNCYGINLEGNGRDAMGMWVSSISSHVTYWELRHGGDATENGTVDVSDLGALATNFGLSGKLWADGDFTGDGVVDVSDLGVLATEFGYVAPTALAAVPEPATLSMLVLGALALLIRRRK